MAVVFTLNGTDYTEYIDLNSLRINMNYRSSWTAEFTTSHANMFVIRKNTDIRGVLFNKPGGKA